MFIRRTEITFERKEKKEKGTCERQCDILFEMWSKCYQQQMEAAWKPK